MLIQLSLVGAIYTSDMPLGKAALKNLFTRRIFLAEIAAFVIITAVSLIGGFLGLNSGFVTKSPFYFMLTVVPALAFVVCYVSMLATSQGSNNSAKHNREAKKH